VKQREEWRGIVVDDREEEEKQLGEGPPCPRCDTSWLLKQAESIDRDGYVRRRQRQWSNNRPSRALPSSNWPPRSHGRPTAVSQAISSASFLAQPSSTGHSGGRRGHTSARPGSRWSTPARALPPPVPQWRRRSLPPRVTDRRSSLRRG